MENIQQHIDNLLNSRLGEVKEWQLTNFGLRKKVYQFDMDNNLVNVFQSYNLWRKVIGGNDKQVKGGLPYKGFYYSYDSDFKIEQKPETKEEKIERLKSIAKTISVQLIKDDVVMYEFDSQLEAAEFLGVHVQTVRGACNGRYKTCKGYVVKKK
jgi:hypothetical protein